MNESRTVAISDTGLTQVRSGAVPLTIEEKLSAAMEELVTIGLDAKLHQTDMARLFRQAADRCEQEAAESNPMTN